MSNLSQYYNSTNFYDTSDATVVVDDLPAGIIAYGVDGRLEAPNPFIQNITAHWDLEETGAADRIDAVDTYNLSAINTPPNAAGKLGNAVDIDGSTQYLTIAAGHPFHSYGGTKSFGFLAWIYSHGIGSERTIVSVANASGSNPSDADWGLRLNGSSLEMFVQDSSHNPITQGTVSANTWYMVYGFYDHINDIHGCSLNGAAATTRAAPTTPNNTGGAFNLGYFNTTLPFRFDGLIDHGTFWTDYILTGADLSWLYNSGAGRTLAEMLVYVP